MSDAHNALITEFYSAFQRLDAEAMAACYTEDVLFSDPAFGTLHGKDAATAEVVREVSEPKH